MIIMYKVGQFWISILSHLANEAYKHMDKNETALGCKMGRMIATYFTSTEYTTDIFLPRSILWTLIFNPAIMFVLRYYSYDLKSICVQLIV